MLKNILNLEGAQQLSKKEQSSINGGGINCKGSSDYRRCNGLGWICCHEVCVEYNGPNTCIQ